jgi:hypothetical protein
LPARSEGSSPLWATSIWSGDVARACAPTFGVFTESLSLLGDAPGRRHSATVRRNGCGPHLPPTSRAEKKKNLGNRSGHQAADYTTQLIGLNHISTITGQRAERYRNRTAKREGGDNEDDKNRVLLSSKSLEDREREERQYRKRARSITGTGCIQKEDTQKKRAPWARQASAFLSQGFLASRKRFRRHGRVLTTCSTIVEEKVRPTNTNADG